MYVCKYLYTHNQLFTSHQNPTRHVSPMLQCLWAAATFSRIEHHLQRRFASRCRFPVAFSWATATLKRHESGDFWVTSKKTLAQ